MQSDEKDTAGKVSTSSDPCTGVALENRRNLFSNQVFDVFLDTVPVNGGRHIVDDFLIVRPRVMAGEIGGVLILPEMEGRVGLMRSQRHQFAEPIWQAPAGFVEPGESPMATARREMYEETGLECRREDVSSLGEIVPDAGLVEARLALFLGRRCNRDHTMRPNAEPGVGELVFFDRDALRSLVAHDPNIGGATLAACARWLLLGEDD